MRASWTLTVGLGLMALGCGSIINVAEETSGSGGSSSVSGGSSAEGGTSSNGGSSAGGMGSGGELPKLAGFWCQRDEDCRLQADVCFCEGRHDDEPSTECHIVGPTTKCEELGMVPQPRCAAGRCVAGFPCDMPVSCLGTPPTCEEGESTYSNGACWGPHCVDASECAAVKGCDACAPDEMCVTTPGLRSEHCVPVPNICNGVGNCACAAHLVCQDGQSCTDGGPNRLTCTE